MLDIASIFKHKIPAPAKVTAYGFLTTEDGFRRDFPILRGTYRAVVTISAAGEVDLKVYDAESGREYLPARVHYATGAFVGEIHQDCAALLADIAEKCFDTAIFQGTQTKRILSYIGETFHAEPEFLWERFPEYAALRVPGKKPWFALVGKVPKEKLGLDEGGDAEVINLKDEPDRVKERLAAATALPAYHMNKKHWYTLILDDRCADETVRTWIDKSYALVEG